MSFLGPRSLVLIAVSTIVLQSTASRPVERLNQGLSTQRQSAQRPTRPTPEHLPGARTEVFKSIDEVELRIHIFEPDELRPGQSNPGIVFFFGGGWRAGDPTQFAQHCVYLASRGMVAMTADYRVLNRHGTKAVTCVKDAKSAIRWIRTNARGLGVDPDRIVAGGGSAGGHLAAAAGVLLEFDETNEDASVSSVPNAMVLFNPPTVLARIGDTTAFDKERFARIQERLGVEPERLSPYHHVREGLPPTLIHHGIDDTTVPYSTVSLFAEAMVKFGNRCELMGYEGEGHGFFNWGRSDNRNFIRTMQETDKFLRSLGYLEGPDTVEQFVASADPPAKN